MAVRLMTMIMAVVVIVIMIVRMRVIMMVPMTMMVVMIVGHDDNAMASPSDVVSALRAAGCVFAEDEAALLSAAATSDARTTSAIGERQILPRHTRQIR